MTTYVRVEYVRTLSDIPSGHSADEQLTADGHTLAWLRYYPVQVGVNDFDYYELEVAEITRFTQRGARPDGQVMLVKQSGYTRVDVDYDGDTQRDAMIYVFTDDGGKLHKADFWL